MKKSSLVFTVKFVSLIMALLVGCQKDPKVIFKEHVSGFVQKGPYVSGTTVNMFELNSGLIQSGKIFTGQILDNDGSFSINNVAVVSPYFEIRANGYYFDETKGALSEGPLELSAICDLTNISSINLNVLTYLENLRIKYLVNQGENLAEAKSVAHDEILGCFGITNADISQFEKLDISKDSESNAALLAISSILINNRSTAELSELLGRISNDMEEDGILDNDAIIMSLRESAISLDPQAIRVNLENRYRAEGIVASVPDFEKYISGYLSNSPLKPTVLADSASEITPYAASLNGSICANSLKTIVGFEYGTTPAYGTYVVVSQDSIDGFIMKSVNSGISGLLPNTVYHFRVKAENSLGVSYSEDMTFNTLGKVPDVSSLNIDELQTASVTLIATINPNFLGTDVLFEYGVSSNYGKTAHASLNQITETTTVNVNVSGLLPNTLYHFRVKAENSLGVSYSPDRTFQTLGKSPGIVSLKVDDLQPDLIRLVATINPNYLPTDVHFEYGVTENYGQTTPALSNTITGNQPVTISGNLTELIKDTYYHIRMKASNEVGTTYSNDIFIKTCGIIYDIEGNSYKTVKIGNQEWMKENLKTTKLKDGTDIPPIVNRVDKPGLCWYLNDSVKYSAVYGALYNYYSVATGKLCPSGWHVPTDQEWSTLINYIGGDMSGYKLKEKGSLHWYEIVPGTDEYFFTALPGGMRFSNLDVFRNARSTGFWFTASCRYYVLYSDEKVIGNSITEPNSGMSVRCIKD